ncbi:MAG: hypothetical protein ACRCV0_05065 [Brevinema sp.]
MSQWIFDSISFLEEKLTSENLNIHETKNKLSDIVEKSRRNPKLRIITQFLVILNALADEYEYEDAGVVVTIKGLIKDSLSIISRMVHSTISYKQAMMEIEEKSIKIAYFFKQKTHTSPFLANNILMAQLAYELKTDSSFLKNLIDQITPGTIEENYHIIYYHLKRLISFIDLLGIQSLSEELNMMLDFIQHQYHHQRPYTIKDDKNVQYSLLQIYKIGDKIHDICGSSHDIVSYINSIKGTIFSIPEPQQHQDFSQISPNIPCEDSPKQTHEFVDLLTSEEISALMDNNQDFPQVDFGEEFADINTDHIDVPIDQSTDPAHYILSQQDELSINHVQTKSYHVKDEDKLLHLTGKLFLKQEQIKSLISQDNNLMMTDLSELDQLTDDIKDVLFGHYYISMKNLLGSELREFIKTEVTTLGKKIRLGIKGEDVDILSREQEFIKQIVFDVVRYSLHESIEYQSRRKALDKSDTAWLLIEFDDSGDLFSIYIRDDGRGLGQDVEILNHIQDQVIEKSGTMDIDSEQNEYLKIRIQIPMKKIITKSLVVEIGSTKLLLPTKSISQVLTPNDATMILKTDHCLGQIALTTLIGVERSPINVYLLCHFGDEKILLGAENILYQTEALMEEVDVPLIPCANSVVILKDGSIGFVMNERKIYTESKKLIEKRTEKLLENTII